MSSEKFSFAIGNNAQYLESLYSQYKDDPSSVAENWQQFFAGYDLAASTIKATSGSDDAQGARVEAYINAFRRLGHLNAHLDPLSAKPEIGEALDPKLHGVDQVEDSRVFHPANLPKQELRFSEIRQLMLDTYCHTIGADFREMNQVESVVWLQEQMEGCRNRPNLASDLKKRILERLMCAEGFEKFLQDRYLGQKRFSVEGTDSLIPLLDTLADEAADSGVEEVNCGMAHRGRLNVLANFMEKDYELVLKEFEGTEFTPFDIDGDVKYHLGFANQIKTYSGKKISLFLSPNPSHLEAVNPVVEGFARARQDLLKDTQRFRVLPLLMHGDAAFAGQGVVAETLNLSELDSYKTGGTIHIIINNQIGFTTNPEEGRSSVYSSELAKFIRAPVLHVNADDPEAVVWTAKLAVAFRQKFQKDIVIDLIGYRRHGHNETDEPSFTQPTMYKKIKKHPTCYKLYLDKLVKEGVVSKSDAEKDLKAFRSKLQSAMERVREGKSTALASFPKDFQDALAAPKITSDDVRKEVKTSVKKKSLIDIGRSLVVLPNHFTPHPKLKKLFETRSKMIEGKEAIDWGMGELLAYGSLVAEGHSIRMSGQDCQRGTFSHRHAVLKDFDTNKPYDIFTSISSDSSKVDIINSPLSEAGVMGFEFGYSVANPNALTLWEAQFGDFVNGAQIIIDQFLVASEAKWKQRSGLVLLLPHGYEGQGPEHSSARIERFLQLCGSLNIQVVTPTTSAQLFHMLRRQILRKYRKPLIVMTPKSLLRHPKVASSIAEFTDGNFAEILDDEFVTEHKKVRRVVLCTGKLYYDLLSEREKLNGAGSQIPLIRIEQMYPFPGDLLEKLLQRYSNADELIWTQEEPMNMGAWYYIRPRLEALINGRMRLSYVGRKGSGTTAEGSGKAHQQEQARIISEALGQKDQNKPKPSAANETHAH